MRQKSCLFDAPRTIDFLDEPRPTWNVGVPFDHGGSGADALECVAIQGPHLVTDRSAMSVEEVAVHDFEPGQVDLPDALGCDGVDVAGCVSVPTGADVATRLGVYTGGYPARIREALLETFPAVATILGDGSLDSLLHRYLPLVPTRWCNLNSVGQALPDFLGSDRLSEELPFLPDLARLEWSVFECFHARVGAPFDFAIAANWDLDDWASASIGFQPGVALVQSGWPIHALRQARERDRSEIDVDLVGHPQSVWLYRQGFDVVTEQLDHADARAAHGLLRGESLGDVMDQMKSAVVDAESVLALFSRFASLGLIQTCQRASDSSAMG